MRVGHQRSLLVEPGRRSEAVDAPAQAGRCQRRMDVDPGQVGGPGTDDRVEVRGVRRRVLRPRRLVPAVAPDRLAGVGRRVVGDQLQAVLLRRRGAQIKAGERQPGRGEMDVAVDERRCDEAAGEVDDLGMGELVAADVVAAEPDHDTVAHRHRGGVGVRRAVHAAVEQQGNRDVSHAEEPRGLSYSDRRAGGSTSVTSMTSPSM